jgi:monoamine oxidase
MTIIIGAGLSGLLTAYRLKNEGIKFKVLEARTRVGGRINTVFGTGNTPIEMGATWFGSEHENLIALLEELGIEYFEQYMDGKVFFQPFSTSPAESIQIPSQPPSYRISGGSSRLINTLYQKLDEDEIEEGQRAGHDAQNQPRRTDPQERHMRRQIGTRRYEESCDGNDEDIGRQQDQADQDLWFLRDLA